MWRVRGQVYFCSSFEISAKDLLPGWTDEFSATYGWPTKAVKFWAEFKRILGASLKMEAGRVTIEGKRSRCIELPPLDQVRKHWEKVYFSDDWKS
jgi:hypothetical protein